MITRSNDMRVEMRDRLRGGEGSIKFIHLVEKDHTCGKLNMAGVLHIQPGQSIGVHPHGPDAELYYLLKGSLTCTDCAEETVLNEGDTMFTCNGATHSVRNDSDQTAMLLAIVIA